MYFDSTKNTKIARPEWFHDGGVPVSDEFLAENGIYRLVDIRPPDNRYQTFVPDLIIIDNGVATQTYKAVGRPLEDAKNWLKMVATTRRYDYEVGGMTLNGVRIATDDRSKSLLNGAYNKALRSISATFKWKAENGFVTLTAAQIIEVGDAVADHVQACFDREMELFEAIDACQTIEDLDGIDIETGWPIYSDTPQEV